MMNEQLTQGNIFAIPSSLPKSALVTGGSIRLGKEIALTLARLGFDIALHVRKFSDVAKETLDEIHKLGRQAALLQAELSVPSEIDSLMVEANHHLGPIGVLVNNASVFDRDEWDNVTWESWNHHLIPNTWAPFRLMQNFAKQLPVTSSGCIINLLDQRVWSLTPHFISYTVSKAALWTLTQTMALALASRFIRVNAVGPGPAMAHKRQTAEQFQRQCQSVPLGYGTSAEEVAKAVVYFVCLPSVTGQMLALDGGQHLQWSPPHEQYLDE